jgi:hypothetical protein
MVAPTSIANSGGSASVSNGVISFETVTSISVNGIFTSSFDNYLIQFVGSADTVNREIRNRYRAAGTDETSSNYFSGGYRLRNNGTAAGWNNDSASFTVFNFVTNGPRNSLTVNVLGPHIADNPKHHGLATGNDTTASFSAFFGGFLNTTTSYDGFTWFPNAGSLTGTIRVYGYKKEV